MNLKDLKEWIKTLPEEFDEFDLVFRKVDTIEPEEDAPVVNSEILDDEELDDEGYYYFLDNPIIAANVDEDNKELCFFNKESADKLEEIEKGIEEDE